ncbi:hypothetical protein Tco_0050758, partial [Tanacetum coccineum]
MVQALSFNFKDSTNLKWIMKHDNLSSFIFFCKSFLLCLATVIQMKELKNRGGNLLVSTYGKAKGRKTIKLHKFFNNSRRNVKVLMNCEKNELRCKRGCDDEDGMMWYRKRRRLS